jgi:hypothetical protein
MDQTLVPPTASEAIRASTAVFLRRLLDEYYDFVDIGTCEGGSFEIAHLLGGQRGLGFELEPSFIERNQHKGIDIACMDVRMLRAPKPCVSFAVCNHLLEHLPNFYDAGSLVNSLRSICRDYIVIAGPCFEEEEYLYTKNVKLLHSVMPDHLCKFKVIDFIKMLHDLRLRDYVIALSEPIEGVDNHWLHSADEPYPPTGLWTYDKTKHRPKPEVTFDRKIFANFICVISLRADVDIEKILGNYRWGYGKKVFRSSWDF